jgi:hypothetical protein
MEERNGYIHAESHSPERNTSSTALKNWYSSVLGYNQYAFILGFLVPCTWHLLYSHIVNSSGKEASRT